MKILAIGYYDDFARFFLSVRKALQKQCNNPLFKYINIHLSGYFYWFFHTFESTMLISFKAWARVLLNKKLYKKLVMDSVYKEINLNEIIRYNTKLGDVSSQNKVLLKMQACAYIDVVEEIIEDFKPDVLLLSDDSRLVIEIINLIGKGRKIKTFYFEQGPFGTTIIDSEGVNANASFRHIKLADQNKKNPERLKEVVQFLNREKSVKYIRNPIYRGVDIIYESIFKRAGGLPIDLRSPCSKGNLSLYNSMKNNHKINDFILNQGKTILLVLQVPNDVNMVYHSPLFKSHFDVVKYVVDAIPFTHNLVIREHPLFKGKYEEGVYNCIKENNNVYIDIDSNLNDLINKSCLVIVNNSTVGIESIAHFKKTVVLGNAYYDLEGICFKLNKITELQALIQRALSSELNKDRVIEYLYQLQKYLIFGHFRDNNLEFTSEVVKKIEASW